MPAKKMQLAFLHDATSLALQQKKCGPGFFGTSQKYSFFLLFLSFTAI
jgi:hypothetical protein